MDEGAGHHKHFEEDAGHPQSTGKIRSGLRKLFGRRKSGHRGGEEEWYWVPEQPAAIPPPPAWTLPSPTEESLRRAQAQGFVTSPGSPQYPQPQVAPTQAEPGVVEPGYVPPARPVGEPRSLEPAESQEPSPGWVETPDLPAWVYADFQPAEPGAGSEPSVSQKGTDSETPPVAQAIPDFEISAARPAAEPSVVDDGRLTILEHSTEPIGGYLEELGSLDTQESVKADQPPPSPDDYRFAREPDRDTLEAVYLPAAPPEPLPGTIDAFSSIEQPAPPEPPPPPPIAVARSTGSFDKLEEGPLKEEKASAEAVTGESRSTGRFTRKRQGPPAFAAEPDVRHVVLGFRDGTAVFLEPEHPLFSLFFQWSELVAGPETPPKAYARRQAQKKFYLGKPARGKPKKTVKKRAGG